MQPGAERAADPEPSGSAGQEQEYGLEGILRRVLVPQDAATGAPDHRPVPLDQGRERRLVAVIRKPFQQLLVRQTRNRPVEEQGVELPEHVAAWTDRHHHALAVSNAAASMLYNGPMGGDSSIIPQQAKSHKDQEAFPQRRRREGTRSRRIEELESSCS